MPACVCFVVGARPNFMKAAPVHRALGELDPGVERLLVHTGQHYDAEMSDVFLDQLGLPRPDVFLGVGSGSHAEQTAAALVGVEGSWRSAGRLWSSFPATSTRRSRPRSPP